MSEQRRTLPGTICSRFIHGWPPMREPDLESVNRALSVTVQKQERELAMLRRALREAADKLERAGWRQSADLARDAAS
jgi:hypothetical protein